MIKDFYHTNRLAVSAMFCRLTALALAALFVLGVLADPAVAQTAAALTTKATAGATQTTDFIKTLAKPVGTVVFVVLAVVMMVVGKQILAKFGWVIMGLILVVMGGSLVGMLYGFFA